MSEALFTSIRMSRNGQADTQLGRLAFVDQGTGPAIVLWPSIMMDADMFGAQVAALSKNHRVIAIDPPGHGDSAALGRTFSLEECGDAVVAILDSCKETSAIIAGNSWGGMVAMNVAARHSVRTRAIVVMNSAATSVSIAHRIEYGLMPTLVRLFGIISPLIAIATRSFLGATAHKQRKDIKAFIASKLRSLDRINIVHVVNSILLGRADQRPLLSRITRPTLIIGGTEDKVFAPAEQQLMQKGIAGSQLVMITAGHFAPLEAAHEVTSEIANFSRRLSPA
jgi:3-oxoadipate enol-lactonase